MQALLTELRGGGGGVFVCSSHPGRNWWCAKMRNSLWSRMLRDGGLSKPGWKHEFETEMQNVLTTEQALPRLLAVPCAATPSCSFIFSWTLIRYTDTSYFSQPG